MDQPVQSYDIEDDLLVCYSGPIEQQEGILHRLFIKNDPFNSTNALCDCSVMRPISGDPVSTYVTLLMFVGHLPSLAHSCSHFIQLPRFTGQ